LIEEGELIKDVVKDVLMKDQEASILTDGGNIKNKGVCIDLLKQSLDDPTLLFWYPYNTNDDWPYIFFLKLAEGKLLPNKDLEASV
jgi:hypothetical protein